jgi:hypothetical protein
MWPSGVIDVRGIACDEENLKIRFTKENTGAAEESATTKRAAFDAALGGLSVKIR